jgi:hypothetical protein
VAREIAHGLGLGEIVRCYTTVSRKNGKLKLMNLTKRLEDLLSITKLLTVFETFDNEEKSEAFERTIPLARRRRGSRTIGRRVAERPGGAQGRGFVSSSSLRPSVGQNLVVLAPLIFARQLRSGFGSKAGAAFGLFCLLSGTVYR